MKETYKLEMQKFIEFDKRVWGFVSIEDINEKRPLTISYLSWVNLRNHGWESISSIDLDLSTNYLE